LGFSRRASLDRHAPPLSLRFAIRRHNKLLATDNAAAGGFGVVPSTDAEPPAVFWVLTLVISPPRILSPSLHCTEQFSRDHRRFLLTSNSGVARCTLSIPFTTIN
jgi:hypothetical protein